MPIETRGPLPVVLVDTIDEQVGKWCGAFAAVLVRLDLSRDLYASFLADFRHDVVESLKQGEPLETAVLARGLFRLVFAYNTKLELMVLGGPVAQGRVI